LKSKQGHIKIIWSQRFLGLLIPLLILSLQSQAQFVKVNIDIPASTGVDGLESFTVKPLTNPKTGKQQLLGFAEFSISAAENMQVHVQVQAESTILNQVQLKTSMAWSNNGTKTLPDDNLLHNNQASFPLSNSSLAGEKRNRDQSLFLAWIFVTVQAHIPDEGSIINDNIINLKIEYN